MLGIDIAGVIVIAIIAGIFLGLYKLIQSFIFKNDVFDYKRDYKKAVNKPVYKNEKESVVALCPPHG